MGRVFFRQLPRCEDKRDKSLSPPSTRLHPDFSSRLVIGG